MTKVNKIIWKDSMFMYPQHLQQQDAYYENLINNYQLLQPYNNWGIFELELDQSYLKLNKILIRKCIGVFPNGMLFSIPDRDMAPEPIEISKDYCNALIYIGVSVKNSYNLDSATLKKDSDYKYYAVEEEFVDLTSKSTDTKAITVAKLNLNIFIEGSSADQVIRLPLFQIINANDGIIIDQRYIPPCLRSYSSNMLIEYQNRVLALLKSYIHSNSVFVEADGSSQRLNKVEGLLILQTITNFKYLFELTLKDTSITPYSLFKEIVSLISSLIIFTKELAAIDLQLQYNHSDIAGSFAPAISLVYSIINTLIEYKPMTINLEHDKNNIFTAKLPDFLNLDQAELILGIELTTRIGSTNEHIVNSLKIASLTDITGIVNLQVSGINFNIIHNLPFYVTYNENTLYLKIKQDCDFWNQLAADKNIAVYLNPRVTEVSCIKLWVIPQIS